MIGTVEKIRYTQGSPFGEQYTTIDGETYMTWFDAGQVRVRVGAKVEHYPEITKFNLNGHEFERLTTHIVRIVE